MGIMSAGIVRYRKGIEMEEFKKWDENNKVNYATISGGKELCVKNERQNAWKAALEMVMGLYKKYDLEDWDTVACSIKEDIEKELKNE